MVMEAVNGQPAKVSQRQPTDPSKGVIIIWVVGKKERNKKKGERRSGTAAAVDADAIASIASVAHSLITAANSKSNSRQ